LTERGPGLTCWKKKNKNNEAKGRKERNLFHCTKKLWNEKSGGWRISIYLRKEWRAGKALLKRCTKETEDTKQWEKTKFNS